MAAVSIVDVYQRNVANTWTQWSPSESSLETPKTFNMLSHPHLHDRIMATTKSGLLRDLGCKANLSYLCTSAVDGWGSTPERNVIFQRDLADMFPNNLEMNHGIMAIARPTGKSDDRTRLAFSVHS